MNRQLQFLKKLTVLFSVSLLVCFTGVKAQTLNPGDLAVIGWNALSDHVHIVTLVDIPAATVIKITDRGWDGSTNAFTILNPSNTGDGIVTWTLSNAVPAGTVLELLLGGADDGTSLNNLTAPADFTSDITITGYLSNDAITNVGDQIFIYQGADTNPFFIFGLNSSSGTVDAANWNTSISASLRDSQLPNASGSQNALTNSVNAIGLWGGTNQQDNVQYTGPISTADRNTWLARITDISNWNGSNDPTSPVNPITSAPTPIVNIAPPNNRPTDIALSNASVNHSAGANAVVGTLSSTDADAGDTHIYTLVSGTGSTDNGSFNIDGSTLRANNAATMAAGTYSVRIQTDDQHGGLREEEFEITVVDDVTPTVSGVDVPANATYVAGQNLDFTVNVSENVTVTGTPQLALTIGTASVNAAYIAGGSTPTALFFRYTIQAGDADPDGIEVGSSINLNEGTINDGAGLPLTLTLNGVNGTTGVLVDGIAPSINSVDVPAPGTYDIGQALSFTVNFDEAVTVFNGGGAPRIPLIIGSATRYASYVSGTETSALVFTYTVDSGDQDLDGISVGASIDLNGSTLQDAAGNNVALTLNSIGSTTGVLVDGVAPTVSSFTPVNGSTDVLPDDNLVVTFSENIALGTGNITIYDDADAAVTTINVASHGGQLSITNNVLTINPTADLSELTDYYVQIGNAAIRDLIGNAYAGITNNTTWAFTVADITAPSGYDVTIDQTAITLANHTAMSFTFTSAEMDATFDYVVTSSNGGTPITGTGTITAAGQQVAGINVSGLANGTLSLSVTLTDAADNESAPVTDNVTKAVSYPPDVTTSSGTTPFIESVSGAPVAVPIDDALTIGDPDNATLASATVAITGNFQSGQDVLVLANDGSTMGNITETYAGGTLSLTSAGAIATLAEWQAALRSVTYSNTSQNPNTGDRIISFVVNDGLDDSAPATKTVTVEAVNTAPVVTVPTSIPVVEDVASALIGISFADGDAGTGSVTTTFTVLDGALAATAGLGVTVGGSPNALILSGNISDINTFIADGNLTYTPVANSTTNVTLTVLINDNGNSGPGGNQSHTEITILEITAVNDAPTITAPTTIAVTEDVASPLTGISFADVDAGSNDVTVTLSVPAGTLNASSGAGVTVGGTSSAMTLTGTIADINAFIAASNATYTTALNATANVMLTVTIDDNGHSGSGGSATDAATITMLVTAINDAPVITNVDGDVVTYTEDGPATLIDAGSNATVTDPDSPDLNGGSLTVAIIANGAAGEDQLAIRNEGPGMVQINVSENNVFYGTIHLGIMAGGTGGEDLIVTFAPTATLAAVQALIRNLTYSNSNTTNPSVNPRTIRITMNDGDGGTSLPSDLTVNVIAVNDNPTIAGLPTDVVVQEDATTDALDISSATISDIDAESGALTLILAATGGIFDVAAGTGITITGHLTNQLTLTGNLTDLNHYISIPSNIYFRPDQDLYGDDAAVVEVSINDNGNTGSGGGNNVALGTINIDITPVNDAPVNTVPADQTVNPGASLIFSAGNGNPISVADVDAEGGTIRVTLTATDGLITLAGTTGLTFIDGDGADDGTMTFDGTITAINGALEGLAFTPTYGFNGAASLQIVTDDLGLTGSGGSLTATDVIDIMVNSISPEVTGVNATSSDGRYKIADVITLTVSFDQMVNVAGSGGSPLLLLETGSTDREAVYVLGSGSNTLVFEYTVQAGDVSVDLDYQSTAALTLNGATIQNTSGDDAVLTLPAVGGANSIAGQRDIVIDGVAPVVSAVDVPADGYYREGDVLMFTVHMDDEVTVNTGANGPYLELIIGTETVAATYTGGSGTDALAFSYTIQGEDQDLDGIAIGNDIVPDGATIRDAAGNEALLALNGVAPTDHVFIYSVSPSVTLSTGATSVNAPFTVTATFSEAVTGFALDDITVTNGTLSDLQTSDNTSYTLLVTPTIGGSVQLSIAADVAVNIADNGNDASNTLSIQFNETITGITLEDRSFVYDGTAKSLAITGTLPDGTTVSYTGNTRTDVGTQEVMATITGDNYEDLALTADLTVTPATITGITLEAGSFVYDGTVKSLAITGTLPDGTTVSYTGNTRTDVGTQEVTATIAGDNYDDLVLTADLTINEATITGITLEDAVYTYDGTTKSLAITGTLPDGTTVSYTGNTRTDVGTQEVTATVEGTGYTPLVLTADLTVIEATITGITLEDAVYTYDGTAKSLTITGTLPDGTTVSYTGNTRTDVGTQEVTATIAGDNYDDLVLTADLTINEATITGITLEDAVYTYDGTAKSLTIDGNLPEGVSATYTVNGVTGNSATDAGIYEVEAMLNGANHAMRTLTAVLTISKAHPVITAAATQSHVYDGTEKAVTATVVPAGLAGQLQYSPQSSFTNVGDHRVRVYLNESMNYLATEAYTDFSITPAEQGGLGLADLTVTYDGNAHSLEVTGAAADATVVYTINEEPGNSATDAGSYNVNAVVSRANHADETLTGTLYINKATAEITAEAVQEFTYDGTEKTVAATLNHTETPLVYAPQRAYTSAGTYTVTVSAAESVNYHATGATVMLRILPAPQEGLALPSRTVTYTGQAQSLSVQGLAGDATVSYTIDGQAGNSATSAGSYEVVAVVSRANHAAITLTGTLAIDRATAYILGEENQVFTYDGTAKSLDVSLNHDETGLTYDPGNSYANAGAYMVTVSAAQSRNHHAVSKSFTLRITPSTRSIDFPTIPAKTYGDADFDAGATASSGEVIAYRSSDPSVVEVTASSQLRITGAGEATITASVPENGNYSNRPEATQVLTVRKATQSITFTAPAEVNRDAGTIPLDVSVSSELPVSLSIDDEEVATLSGTSLNILRLGTVRITATQAGDANHEAAEPVTVTVRVVDPTSDMPIRIHKAVSPNGDGINEYLIIEAIKDYPENRVRIFNRNGTVVYEASGYNNGTLAFRGIGSGQNRVQAGTYFYVAEIRVDGEWKYEKGWFVLRY